MRLWRCSLIVLAFLLAVGVGVSAQNLVTNGDFEGTWTPAPPGLGDWVGAGWTAWTARLAATPSSQPGDPAMWSMPGNTGVPDPNVNNYQRIIGGSIRSSNFRGGIYQVVNTVAGQAYDLDIDARMFRANSTNQAVIPTGSVGYDLTGQTTNPLAASINWINFQESDAWSRYSVRFNANGPTSIWVRGIMPEATAWLMVDVDNVSVQPAGSTLRINITDGPKATQVSDTTFEIEWTTDVPSSSVVEYGPAAPNGDDGAVYPLTAQAPGNVQVHKVLLTGLSPDKEYHYRVRSSATGYKTVYSVDKTFRTPPEALPVFTNGSFEQIEGSGATRTAVGWRSFPVVGGGNGGDASGYIGPYPTSGVPRWLGLVNTQHGQYFAGAGGNWDRKQGGFYQRFKAVPGMTYRVDAYIATFANGGAPWDCQVWVGIDPKGGVDPGPAPDPNDPNPKPSWIVWSTDPAHGDNTLPVKWVPVSVETVAQSNAITVFVRFQQKWQLQTNITAVDNIRVTGPPAETIQVASIGQAKAQPDYAMVETTNGAIVTLVPLSESGFFYVQDEDGTAGIRVESGASVSIGDKVKVKGILRTLDTGERVLRDTTVTKIGTGTTKIRNIGSRSVGGPRFVGPDGQPTNVGVETEGLLVRVYGKVTKMDWLEGYFLLDDGSGVDAQDDARGVKVIRSEVYPMPGDYLSIVGVITSEVRNGKTIRVLRGREQQVPSDYTPLAP